MKCHIFDIKGFKIIDIIDSTPICGEDVCDYCGDCLVCYIEDPCYESPTGEHYWVKYVHEGGQDEKSTS